jgi:D-amino peptidase
MVEGVQQAEVVFFIGYHARANTPDAILCHTWTDQVRGVWLNDQEVGKRMPPVRIVRRRWR